MNESTEEITALIAAFHAANAANPRILRDRHDGFRRSATKPLVTKSERKAKRKAERQARKRGRK